MKSHTTALLAVLLAASVSGCMSAKTLSPEHAAYRSEAMAHPLTWTMPKAAAADAWGRAQTWIAQHSSMKIQIATDYVLQTYNPDSEGWATKYGYNVSASPAGESVQITVTCTSGTPYRDEQIAVNAHLLAYYMSSGKPTPAEAVETY
jgi:uncharacterized lipoprotein